MASKFISVLGKNQYDECDYGLDRKFNYSQEAIIRKHEDEISEVVIFATSEARKNNWEGQNLLDEPALKLILKQMQAEGFDFEIDFKEIPNGYSENEIWDIFDKFVEKINEGDNIFLDITHGFRYQPMLIMSILNYTKVLKNINIEKIEYGLYNGEDSKILDLTSLNYLNEWVVATDSFLTTGSIRKIEKLSEDEIKKVLAKTKGKDKFFKNLRALVNKLKEFNLKLKTCRGKELHEAILNVLKELDKFGSNPDTDNKKILPFIKLIDKIKDKFSYFSSENGEEKKNYLKALKWCSDHNLIQQGLTILTENIITIVADEINQDYYNQEVREDVAQALNYAHKKFLASQKGYKTPSKKNLDIIDQNIFNKALDFVKTDYEEIFKLFDRIGDSRNDINHFGFRKSSSGAIQLRNKLEKHINEIENLIT
ncbi:MAG: TIGR02221 family CRISPR-associated protein [Bacillota bacterium]